MEIESHRLVLRCVPSNVSWFCAVLLTHVGFKLEVPVILVFLVTAEHKWSSEPRVGRSAASSRAVGNSGELFFKQLYTCFHRSWRRTTFQYSTGTCIVVNPLQIRRYRRSPLPDERTVASLPNVAHWHIFARVRTPLACF